MPTCYQQPKRVLLLLIHLLLIIGAPVSLSFSFSPESRRFVITSSGKGGNFQDAMTLNFKKMDKNALGISGHRAATSFSSTEGEGNSKISEQDQQFPSSKFITVLWIHILSIFMITNYFWGAFPQPLFNLLSVTAWNFLHAISAMVFSGSIITTAAIEWDIDARFATKRLFPMERILVLPALSLNVLSGVAQVFGTYLPDNLRYAPPHVKSVFHVLFLFGLWWGFTDRKSQGPVQQLVEAGKASEEETRKVLQQRRFSNVVSCLFVLALYAIMIFKPGY